MYETREQASYTPDEVLYGPITLEEHELEQQIEADLNAPTPEDVAEQIDASLLTDMVVEVDDTDTDNGTPGQVVEETVGHFDDYTVKTFDSSSRALVHTASSLGENVFIANGCPIGEKTTIGNNCSIESKFVGREVTMGDNVTTKPGSRIGVQGKGEGWEKPGVSIGSDAVIEQGVILRPNSSVGRRTHVGEGSVIGFKENTKKTGEVKGNTKAARPTIIGDDCEIGHHVKVEVGAKIGNGYYVANETIVPGDFSIASAEETGVQIIDRSEILRQKAMRTPKQAS